MDPGGHTLWNLTVLPGCHPPTQQAPVAQWPRLMHWFYFAQLFSETGSHCVTQMILEFATLLLLPLKCSDCEYAPLYLALP